ncbi:16S rRNA (cytidine(1402)-2'-O)-methyltransferase [hydrothermal vent metagenome]|uniref:16S rRNA (Cytidine(1402)-2'-O)-methyltransferase n=1 Tax=hydrothermal vent metagenome TaxID=652676 RepID=A0A3B1C735_9ZZZZ
MDGETAAAAAAEDSGTLYLVASPVGNLADITNRAVKILKSVDIIAAEDTRHTRRLLDHYEVKGRRLTSYHAHNVERKTPVLIEELKEGKSIALISDAGSPGISDPGAVLVREAVEEKIVICPIPGPSAPTLAVTASGFPSHRFVFEGFLPRKKGRKTLIESWRKEKRTIVFFEAPVRIVKTLNYIKEMIGDRKVCVARELTKKFEEFIRGDISDVIGELESRTSVKGEITVVVAPEGF